LPANSSFPLYFTSYSEDIRLTAPEKLQIEVLIDNYSHNTKNIEYLGKGTCGTVYKIKLPNKNDFAVKILSEDAVTEYGGGNLEKEAKILKQIPKSCKRTQQLIDYFKTQKREYLASTLIKGTPLKENIHLTQEQLNNIIDELYKYDINGLMFYDLNDNNIFINGDNAGFIDFEFLEKKNPKKINILALNDKHHLGRNLYFPQKSNLNSFENRTLGKIIENLETSEADELIKKYLKSLSLYYSKMSNIHKNNYKAYEYEKILSRLYKNPSPEIVATEKNQISLRSLTLNYHLYKLRKKQQKLIDGDIETYGDIKKYKKTVHELKKEINKQIKKLSLKTDNPDIAIYCAVNKSLTNIAPE